MIKRFEPIDLTKLGLKHERPEISSEEKAERTERGRKEFQKRKNGLILKAIFKHVQAVSYRGFRVGASLVAENKTADGGYVEESEHNFKPREHKQNAWDKLCAENNICSAAIMDGAGYIPGIVVASHHRIIGKQKEDDNHSQDVLHSCMNCRNLFRDLIKQGIMDDETVIRFVNDDSLVYEDEADKEFMGTDNDGQEVWAPKLKLRREITEQDVADLPNEEMTMKEFLSLEKYKNDLSWEKGYTPAPYDLVS
jgi:cytidine deaminase